MDWTCDLAGRVEHDAVVVGADDHAVVCSLWRTVSVRNDGGRRADESPFADLLLVAEGTDKPNLLADRLGENRLGADQVVLVVLLEDGEGVFVDQASKADARRLNHRGNVLDRDVLPSLLELQLANLFHQAEALVVDGQFCLGWARGEQPCDDKSDHTFSFPG